MESKSPWKLSPVPVIDSVPVKKNKSSWEKKRKSELSAMSEDELFDAVLDEEEASLLLEGANKHQKVDGEDSEVIENVFSAPEDMEIISDLGISGSYNDGEDSSDSKDDIIILGKTTYGDFRKAILTSGGMITHVARRLNLSTRLVKRIMEKYKSLGQMFEEFREAMLDEVEMWLMKKIRSGERGDTLAMIFYLKCVGKERGYIDRVVDTKDKKTPVKLKIVGTGSYVEKKKPRVASASERTLQ